ncbi:MAG TPA: MASE1 domain-containing protein [Planctomycetota bacterium]
MLSATAEVPARSRGALRTAAAAAGVGAVYFIAGKLGLRLAVVHESATAVWAPAGVALAGYLLFGREIWPGLFAAAFLVNATTLSSAPAALGIAAGNTLEGLVGALLLEKTGGGRKALDTAGGVLRFAGFAGLLATLVAATLGPATLWLAGLAPAAQLPEIALTWWLGDAMGVLLIAPLILLWAPPTGDRRPVRAVEGFAFLALLALVSAVVFGEWTRKPLPIGFLMLPLMMWAAFRFGLAGTSAVAVMIAAIALWSTLHGRGPYVVPNRNQTLLILQSYMGITGTTCLAVAAAVEDRRRRLREVTALNATLDARKAELSTLHRLLSHDVSNVATASLALLERLLLQADGPLTPKQEELARRAYRQAMEMNRMTENARLLLRARDLGTSIPREPIDVQPVLRKTLETVRMTHFDRPFDVETFGTERLRLDGPPFLESILLNLIDNAVRHTARGKKPAIRILATEHDRAVTLAVRGGEPASPERLARLFAAEAEGGRPPGHGLGLRLVRELVEREGGAMRVGTAKDDGGERFEVELLLPRR